MYMIKCKGAGDALLTLFELYIIVLFIILCIQCIKCVAIAKAECVAEYDSVLIVRGVEREPMWTYTTYFDCVSSDAGVPMRASIISDHVYDLAKHKVGYQVEARVSEYRGSFLFYDYIGYIPDVEDVLISLQSSADTVTNSSLAE